MGWFPHRVLWTEADSSGWILGWKCQQPLPGWVPKDVRSWWTPSVLWLVRASVAALGKNILQVLCRSLWAQNMQTLACSVEHAGPRLLLPCLQEGGDLDDHFQWP